MFILFFNLFLAWLGYRFYRPSVRPLLPVLNGFGLVSNENLDEFIDKPFGHFVDGLRLSQQIHGI